MSSSSAERPAGTVDPKLLELLVCPLTKGPLEYDAEKQELISRSAKLAYPFLPAFRSCCRRKRASSIDLAAVVVVPAEHLRARPHRTN